MTTLAATVRGAALAPVQTTYTRRAVASDAATAPSQPAAASVAARPPARGEEEEADLAEARHEVFQLGLEGMSRQRRKDALQQKLVRLGAKPPPRTATNYKQMMVEAKERKVAEKAEKEALRKSGLALPNLSALKDLGKKTKRPRLNKNKVRGFDGQPGRFKKGVQIVPRRVQKS